MKVIELIAALQAMPKDARVMMLWDGDLRSGVDACWLTRSGKVGLGPTYEPIYTERNRIAGAASSSENSYLTAGEMLGIPNNDDDDDDDDEYEE